MVIFHVHEGCIRIGFTIIVSSLKSCRMPVINGLSLKEFVKKQKDSFLAVCEANIIKYLYRYPMKNNVEDLRKVAEYATMAADYLEENGGEEDA